MGGRREEVRARNTSHVTRHTSHVTRHTSPTDLPQRHELRPGSKRLGPFPWRCANEKRNSVVKLVMCVPDEASVVAMSDKTYG